MSLKVAAARPTQETFYSTGQKNLSYIYNHFFYSFFLPKLVVKNKIDICGHLKTEKITSAQIGAWKCNFRPFRKL